jgi:hypothetical protein
MVMVLSNYKNKNAVLILENEKKIPIGPISNYRNKEVKSGQFIVIAKRIKGNSWKLQETIEIVSDIKQVTEALSIESVWKKMTKYWSDDNAANDIEVEKTLETPEERLLATELLLPP